MASPVNDIRCKAFEDEMNWAIPELIKINGFNVVVLQPKIESYLNKHFAGYIDWHFNINQDRIIFYINAAFCLEHYSFELPIRPRMKK